MKVILPIEVTPAKLTTSNVPITETAWVPDNYPTGTQRYVGTTLYEVVAITHTTDEPTAGAAKNPPTWVKVSSINRFKMFDFTIGAQTTRATPISVGVTPGSSELVTAVALFQLVGVDSVRVRVDDPIDGVVYDETQLMADYTGIFDWWAYFFLPYNFRTDAIFFGLPAYIGAELLVDIVGGGTVEIGELVLGQLVSIGSTSINTTLGIEDFSRKVRDEFGNFEIVERRFSNRAEYDILIENQGVRPAIRTLAAYRAKPAVYIGDVDQPETYILGFYNDFTILRNGPITSEMSIQIEGLI